MKVIVDCCFPCGIAFCFMFKLDGRSVGGRVGVVRFCQSFVGTVLRWTLMVVARALYSYACKTVRIM